MNIPLIVKLSVQRRLPSRKAESPDSLGRLTSVEVRWSSPATGRGAAIALDEVQLTD